MSDFVKASPYSLISIMLVGKDVRAKACVIERSWQMHSADAACMQQIKSVFFNKGALMTPTLGVILFREHLERL
jgi:hypothetical protein